MSEKGKQPAIENLVDFYRCWPELRAAAVHLKNKKTLDPEDVDVLDWMIRIVDRVGPSDLEKEV